MQFRRSAIDVAGRSGPRFSGNAALLERVAPRPGRRPGSDGRSARKPRSGGAWLALTLGVALLPAVGHAQTVEWARSAGGTSRDGAFGIAVDDDGNSYVTGRYDGTATFGSFTLTSAGSDDIFVAKYDTGGNVLWVRPAGGTSFDAGYGIAVDAAGNSYVTGKFDTTATFGTFTLTSAGSGDIFVAKYDGSGNVLWARSAGGTSSWDDGRAIGVDAAGNSYVTGRFGWPDGVTATFGTFTLTSAGFTDIFVAKFDSSGSVIWARSAGGTFPDRGLAIAVDDAGNSYVTGRYDETATFGSFTLTSAGGYNDIFVAKYDAGGSVLWARSAGGTSDDRGYDVGVDNAGNSHVTGWYSGTATFGPFTLTSAGGADIFVAKYDGTGNVLWAQSAGGTSDDRGYDVAVDAAGNSYVTGTYGGTATFGSFTLTSAGFNDIFVAKYNTSGNVLWARSAGGTGGILGEWGSSIAVDAAGNSYVTGSFYGPATFGSFTLTSAGGQDIFVAKYAAPGVTAILDIKPGSCPNPVNVRSRGVVPLTIVGNEAFDVTEIDGGSLTLTRADGVGASVTPIVRRNGWIGSFEDVTTPFNGEPCDCHELGGDGVYDLVLKFSTQEMADLLELDSEVRRASVMLTVSGTLLDGTAFEASDCVVITGRAAGSRQRGIGNPRKQ